MIFQYLGNSTFVGKLNFHVFFIVLFFVPVAISVLIFTRRYADNSFEARVARILNVCQDVAHRPSCYDKEIPKETADLSLADSFTVTKIVQERDQNYWYCHVLGHELSARETNKDPARWKDVVAQCPSGMCSNGCIHGAFQERFRKEAFDSPAEAYALVPELSNACEERENWRPTGMEQATCYHALGHLAMYITSADITTAIDICGKVAVKTNGRDFRQVCYDGAFMQIYQPLEPEDFALVEGKNPSRAGLFDYCKNFEGRARASCWSESWPLFGEEIKTPTGLTQFCSLSSGQMEQQRCYSGMFYVITAQFNFDDKKIVPFCAGISDERKGECFSQAASRLIETDYGLVEKAIGLCNAAEKIGAGEECFNSLVNFSLFNFTKGSKEALQFCEKLPGGQKNICFSLHSVR